MSITCQICQKSFDKIIPWQHLKTHNVSTDAYKDQYGSVYSEETLAKFASRIPHNKGKKVTDPDQLAKINAAIVLREERFKNGEIKRGAKCTEERRQKLSQRNKEYAAANPESGKQRAAKALSTKIAKGFDFTSPNKGKLHSNETKEKISAASKETNKIKSADANNRILDRIASINLSLINDVAEPQMQLKCLECDTEFSYVKAYFHLSKFKETLCPTCFPRIKKKSKGETELFDFIKSIADDAVPNYRKAYHSKEIDVFVPSKNIGFEFNGLYWHSEDVLLNNNKSPKSDFDKKNEFSAEGITLIQIFEDEWHCKTDIVKSRIQNILTATQHKIYARECSVSAITSKDAAKFCNEHHIMGAGRSNVRYGLYHKAELVSVMTFSKNNLSRKVTSWELNRFASKINTNVVGGASRLFARFVKDVNPESVISYSDNRWSTGNLYQQLGFTKNHNGTPNYWYVAPNSLVRIHRFSLRKSVDNKLNLPEKEIRQQQGYLRIWDSGSSKWTWNKP